MADPQAVLSQDEPTQATGFLTIKQIESPLFASQEHTIKFSETTPIIFDISDPGTGKTRSHIEIFRRRRSSAGSGKLLVLAPKSILQPAWGNDLNRFAPELKYAIASAEKRSKAFATPSDVYITNHDAVKFLAENQHFLEGYSDIVIDESTAFKNGDSQRSRALRDIVRRFPYRRELTGTPNPTGVLDLWHQILLLDQGQRLGTSYYRFRAAVCEPRQIGPSRDFVEWVEKPGIELAVAELLADITVRHRLEDCHDMPEHVIRNITFNLSPAHQRAYNTLAEQAMLELASGTMTAIHSGALAGKLFQLASGAVYDNDHVIQTIATERYELVTDLVEERQHSLVAYNWDHQLQNLLRLAKARNLPVAYINGSVSSKDRTRIVEEYQAGRFKAIYAHPASAAHGLTLTRGTSTIWASPTYRAEHYLQFNRRIYRAGQKQRTDTINITAAKTLEGEVYAALQGHLDPIANLLGYLTK